LAESERKRRSAWREMSFFVFMATSNIVCLDSVIGGFAKISRLFLAEKRVKERNMQLANTC